MKKFLFVFFSIVIMLCGCSDSSANVAFTVNDVESSKDELVFYLMSRGIEYNDCIKLLVKGFLFSNIDVDNKMRERILNVIDMYWG